MAMDGGFPMSERGTSTDSTSDPVLEFLSELDRLDNSHDPTVAIFDGIDGTPVVAKVGRGYRMLSSNIIYAREISIDDIRASWDEQGEPRSVALSTQTHRFDASDFAEVADLE